MNRKHQLHPMLFLLTLLGTCLSCVAQAFAAPAIADYTAYPPFLSQQTTSNVLIILDNSLSMNEFAYKVVGQQHNDTNADHSYDATKTYYGYFDSSELYLYSTNAGGHFYVDAAGTWSGNFLNWLTMRRIDIVKKVLVGGKATPRSGGTQNYLLVDQGGMNDFYKYATVNNTLAPFSGTRCFQVGLNGTNLKVNTNTSGTCSTNAFTAGTYNIKIKYSDSDEPTGLVQRTWDSIRFGLMVFNDDGTKYEDGGNTNKDGGYMMDWMKTGNENKLNAGNNVITRIENMAPSTYTPLAETLYEATRYFGIQTSAYNNDNYSAHDPIASGCQKNYVLLLTDGESTKDRNIPGGTGHITAEPRWHPLVPHIPSMLGRKWTPLRPTKDTPVSGCLCLQTELPHTLCREHTISREWPTGHIQQI